MTLAIQLITLALLNVAAVDATRYATFYNEDPHVIVEITERGTASGSVAVEFQDCSSDDIKLCKIGEIPIIFDHSLIERDLTVGGFDVSARSSRFALTRPQEQSLELIVVTAREQHTPMVFVAVFTQEGCLQSYMIYEELGEFNRRLVSHFHLATGAFCA